MRGRRNPQITMLAFIDLEERVPTSHPLRTIRRLADEALTDLSATFDQTDLATTLGSCSLSLTPNWPDGGSPTGW